MFSGRCCVLYSFSNFILLGQATCDGHTVPPLDSGATPKGGGLPPRRGLRGGTFTFFPELRVQLLPSFVSSQNLSKG